MIGKLTGVLDYRGADHLLVDVQGVGYLVYCSERTLAGLPPRGGTVALYTDLLVREDNLQLFGFPTLAEKEWHRLLTSVQGVGAKVALAIAGTLGVDGVGRAITLGDVAAIKAAPGVGPKLAQRIVVELKDKAAGVIALGAAGAETARAAAAPDGAPKDGSAVPVPAQAPAQAREQAREQARAPAADTTDAAREAGARADALSALVNLGYGHSDAAEALQTVAASHPGAGAAALIKAALKALAPE